MVRPWCRHAHGSGAAVTNCIQSQGRQCAASKQRRLRPCHSEARRAEESEKFFASLRMTGEDSCHRRSSRCSAHMPPIAPRRQSHTTPRPTPGLCRTGLRQRPDIPLNRLKPVFPLVALDFSPARTPFPPPSRRVETRRYTNSKRAEARSPVGRDRGAPPTVALYTMLVYREPNNVSMPPADPP